MTVQEVIDKLSKFNKTWEVKIEPLPWTEPRDIESVYEDKENHAEVFLDWVPPVKKRDHFWE